MFRRLVPFAVCALLVTSGCSKSRSAGSEGTAANAATGCTRCHGGGDNGTGAPPVDLAGRTDASLRSVGAHSAHVTVGALAGAIDCGECHVKPTSPDTHQQPGGSKLRWGLLATDQGATTPTFDGTRCSNTYCHGATLNAGGSNHAPVWTGGKGEAACGTCHATPPPFPHVSTSDLTHCTVCHPETMDANGEIIPASKGGKHVDGTIQAAGHDVSWMDTTSPNFHAYAADADLASCTRCHGAQLDGGTANVACTKCHVQGGTANPFGCTMCHGGTDNTTGAPPAATWGHAGDPTRGGGTLDPVRVGAHTAHVTASPISPAFDCNVCHVKPTNALSPGHVDGNPTVTFAGLALTQGATPTWNLSAATCSSTYCHGAFDGGNRATPVWTGGSSQGSCGTCHGTPPPAPHPTAALTDCVGCHPDTMNADGTVIPPAQGGKHLDGIVEAQGHPASWMNQADPGFHAYSADANIAACQGCHGAQLDGGSAKLPCASCHNGTTANAYNCTGCHGGGDNQTGAPPRGIWGAQTDPGAIGAHTAHVTASAISPAFDCNVCHVKPADALSPGHVDGNPTVTFAGIPLTQGANPTWNASAATCSSTYCHGAFTGGNHATPVWTGGSSQGACGTCHDTPPPAPHPAAALTACSGCHAQTMNADGTLIPPAQGGKHLDGIVEATGGHNADWMNQSSPGFHAFSAEANIQSCTQCHGADLASCSSCHNNTGGGVGAHDFATCTACHGGTENQTGAPPAAIWGQAGDPNRGGGTLDPIRVGAHTTHVAGSTFAPPFDCDVCHVKPTGILSAGHIDGPTATLTFNGLATNGGASPSWTRSTATCASTYCHGATLSGGTATTTPPVWTGSNPSGCGWCHGFPPPTPHPSATPTQCTNCHPETVDGSGNLIPPPPLGTGKHLDGIIEAVGGHPAGWTDPTSSNFHAFSADTNIQSCTTCHGADLGTCAQCHKTGGPGNPLNTCTACHGGIDNQTGAPPRTIWGQSADTVRVGAHTAHVAGGAIRAPLDCSACHVKPTDALSPGHIDTTTGTPMATVTWGALATGNVTPAGGFALTPTTPSWDRSNGGTCSSTYCHGSYSGTYSYEVYDWGSDTYVTNTVNFAGAKGAPTWTAGAMTCTSCHGNPPAGTGVWHSGLHGGGQDYNDCSICHPDAAGKGATARITNPALHVDGQVNLAPNFTTNCTGCH